MHYLSQFSLIWSQNCTLFVFLDSLLCEECSEIFLELFLTRSTGWGTESVGSLGSIFRKNS